MWWPTALSGLVGVFLGGIGSTLLKHWLSRARLSVVITAVAPGGPSPSPDRASPARITETARDLANKSGWCPPLREVESDWTVEKAVRDLRRFLRDADPALETVGALRRDLDRQDLARNDKIALLGRLSKAELVWKTVARGLRTSKLKLPDCERTEEIVQVSLTPHPKSGEQVYCIEYPDFRHAFGYGGVGQEHDLQLVRPLVEAVQFFQTSALAAALDYARPALLEEKDCAQHLIAELEQSLQSHWQLRVVVANGGDRVATVTPYAVLSMPGGRKRFKPVALTCAVIGSRADPGRFADSTRHNALPEDDDEIGVATEQSLPHFREHPIIEPQSVIELVFLSDEPMVKGGQPNVLRSAYDSEILDCRVTLKRGDCRGWRGRPLFVRSRSTMFGKGIEERDRQEVMRA